MRTELLDYGFPSYEENREVYCNNGISQNDLELYRYWNYGDPDRFTEDALKNVIEAKEEKTKSGIFLPDTAKEKPQEGVVVAVGAGKVYDNGQRVAPEVKVGDTVMFAKYAGSELEIDGATHLIISERDILAVL